MCAPTETCQALSSCWDRRVDAAAWADVTACYNTNCSDNCAPLCPRRLGLTRTNVYAGMAGFYIVRERFPSLANGPELPGMPYPAYDGIIPIGQVRELPLAIADRSFTDDSQLWYPVANNPPSTVLPNGPLHPRWIPEYSATAVHPITGLPHNYVMMTVNGRTYPRHVSACFSDSYYCSPYSYTAQQ